MRKIKSGNYWIRPLKSRGVISCFVLSGSPQSVLKEHNTMQKRWDTQIHTFHCEFRYKYVNSCVNKNQLVMSVLTIKSTEMNTFDACDASCLWRHSLKNSDVIQNRWLQRPHLTLSVEIVTLCLRLCWKRTSKVRSNNPILASFMLKQVATPTGWRNDPVVFPLAAIREWKYHVRGVCLSVFVWCDWIWLRERCYSVPCCSETIERNEPGHSNVPC